MTCGSSGATEALLTGNNEELRVLAEREQVINALDPEIEKLVNREILLQAPVAPKVTSLGCPYPRPR